MTNAQGQGYSIPEAAKLIGISTRQVRRYISKGKLKAELVPGKFGMEYRITVIPPDLVKGKTLEQPFDFTPTMAMDIIKTLQEENRNLAGQLGAAQERIKSLEEHVKLLAAPKKPWYRRIFGR